MEQQITTLEPQELWHFFDKICQIPHPSGKEEKIREYIVNYGKNLSLQTQIDEVGNILICKPATPGYEKAPILLLQAHIDMVCEKNEETIHDFEKDPIKTYIDGDWVKAHGTTLGADNGIGVASMLAILGSNTIKHGKLKCIFTIDEERGLTGAQHVCADWLNADMLLNLDSEEDGRFCIGCAGGIETCATFEVKRETPTDDLFFAEISISGLKGGHSGDDINKGRANAIQLLARFLWEQKQKYPLYIADIIGGNLHNAIPREAKCSIAIPYKFKEELRIQLNIYTTIIENEYPTEGKLAIELSSENRLDSIINASDSEKIINTLFALPNGVIEMSREIENLPETSTNLASIKRITENSYKIATSQRSSTESKKIELKNRMEALFIIGGASSVTHSDGYPGWKPNLQSPIKEIVVQSFAELFGYTPIVSAIHAGLECGLFKAQSPNLDMISIGPEINGNHSPNEQCSISSVKKYWQHLNDILARIAEIKQ